MMQEISLEEVSLKMETLMNMQRIVDDILSDTELFLRYYEIIKRDNKIMDLETAYMQLIKYRDDIEQRIKKLEELRAKK